MAYIIKDLEYIYFFKEAFITLKNFFIDAINGIITLINKIPGVEIDKLERAGEKTPNQLQEENQTKKDFQALVKEGEEDQALKEKIVKSLEVSETGPFTLPNLGVNERQNANLEFANAGTAGNTVINNVIGGSQQNVSSSNSNINTMSTSKNIDDTMINLQNVSA